MQQTKSRRGKKVYVSYLIRESFRTAKGPRSRTVSNVTGLPESIRNIIAQALRGKQMVATDVLSLDRALDYGGVAVLLDAWKRYGLDAIFARMGNKRQQALIKAMIFGRLLFPSSKLALKEEAEGTLLAEACGLDADENFDEDDLYQAMDAMHGKWVHVEKSLYAQAFPLSVNLVLYDLTSVYFEGEGPRQLACYGHSRDHRADRPQTLLAVATNAEGIPIHVEVLRGDRADNTTLQGLSQILHLD